MPNPSQVIQDNDAFINQENDIQEKIIEAREKLNGTTLIEVCVLCGEDIGDARKAAIPYAVNCIDCAKQLEEPVKFPMSLTRRQRRAINARKQKALKK